MCGKIKSGCFCKFTAKIVLMFFVSSVLISPAQASQVPVSYVTSYSYDANGNVNSIVTPGNDSIIYEYDSLNRIKRKTYPDNTYFTYDYDSNGNRTEVADHNGKTTSYSYDRYNRLVSVQYPEIMPIYYEYDNSGTWDRLGTLLTTMTNL